MIMNPQEVTRQYLSQINIMQLATAFNDQPWACTVHFYADENMNIYWLSNKHREHSKQIEKNPNVAAAILVHENTPSEKYVIGISVAGTAELLSEIPEAAIRGYMNKLSKDPQLIENVKNYVGDEGFYCLVPSRVVLFDSKNFPDKPRQEVRL